MHGADPSFIVRVTTFLGTYYLILAVMNAVAAAMFQYQWKRTPAALVSLAAAFLFVLLAAFSWNGTLPSLGHGIESLATSLLSGKWGAVSYTIGTTAALVILYLGRRFFAKPVVAWAGLNLTLLLMGLSMTNPYFWEIVSKPDNVPIVMLVLLLGFFTWLATWKAVQNDDRAREGLPPLEKDDSEKVLVWPDLVYTELICMVLLTAFLLVWAILLKAPLEEPASSVKTPNPSKAPWYFLGLQEMLVYFDPWMAGVLLPSLVIVGLMAIPYLDFNKEGNGYYTIEKRKFAYVMFQVGFLELWVTLIVLGTFLRGPNWNFFSPFEYWDAHKVEAGNNVNLSDYFWINFMGASVPRVTSDMGVMESLLVIFKREGLGIILCLGYLIVLPPLMAATVLRPFFVKMGFIRYMVLANLILFMAALPIKMVLRWTLDLKYLVYIPEFFINI